LNRTASGNNEYQKREKTGRLFLTASCEGARNKFLPADRYHRPAVHNGYIHGVRKRRRPGTLGSTRALACWRRRPRRRELFSDADALSRKDAFGGGAKGRTRGRVRSPEPGLRRSRKNRRINNRRNLSCGGRYDSMTSALLERLFFPEGSLAVCEGSREAG